MIDYNEFVAMMRQGNGGIGRKSLTGSWTSGKLIRDLLQSTSTGGRSRGVAEPMETA